MGINNGLVNSLFAVCDVNVTDYGIRKRVSFAETLYCIV
jgi:hypothetical protein